jgi:hypothetical protein
MHANFLGLGFLSAQQRFAKISIEFRRPGDKCCEPTKDELGSTFALFRGRRPLRACSVERMILHYPATPPLLPFFLGVGRTAFFAPPPEGGGAKNPLSAREILQSLGLLQDDMNRLTFCKTKQDTHLFLEV